MKIGYCRVSTAQQSLDLQIDALQKEGCERGFGACPKHMGDDTLVAWLIRI